MRPMVSRGGGLCVLYRLAPVLLGSLWLMGGLPVEGAVPFWIDVTPGGFKPDRRHGHGLAYDTARGKVVLFGGGDGWTSENRPATLFQDTWEWDGAGGPVRRGNPWGPAGYLGVEWDDLGAGPSGWQFPARSRRSCPGL
ncbi:MAG: hypothetical protein ACREOH_23875, partial [Candidatus Entotheonellia bacterium]